MILGRFQRLTFLLDKKEVHRPPRPSRVRIYCWALTEDLRTLRNKTCRTSNRRMGPTCVARTWHTLMVRSMEPTILNQAQRTLTPFHLPLGQRPWCHLQGPDMRRPNDAYARRRSATQSCMSHPMQSVPCRFFPPHDLRLCCQCFA
jgi:hypothetical protein